MRRLTQAVDHVAARFRGLVILAVAGCLSGCGPGGAHQALTSGPVWDLGPPAEVTSPVYGHPLSGFHRVRQGLPATTAPELLFLGTELGYTRSHHIGGIGPVFDVASALERWPVVKALDQFGRFKGLRVLTVCSAQGACLPPTFDWSHASYASPYVRFVHRDLLNGAGRRFQAMQPAEKALYYLYARNPSTENAAWSKRPGTPYTGDYPDNVLTTLLMQGRSGTRRLPMVMVDHYVQTASEIVFSDDFEEQAPGTTAPGGEPRLEPLSFSGIQRALQTGRNPSPDSHLVTAVNAEANVLTALICHADRLRPARVCRRPAIRSILSHVR